MPTIQRVTVIGIGATNENILAGNPNEFIGGRPAVVSVSAVRDTGGNAGVGDIEILFGQRQIYAAAPLGNSSADGRGPLDPEDQIARDVAAPGDRITVRVTETGGAATLTARTRVDITPL